LQPVHAASRVSNRIDFTFIRAFLSFVSFAARALAGGMTVSQW